MSIGGIVTVHVKENGSGTLELKEAKRGEGTGQPRLHFDSAPEDVTALNGRLIWGGDSTVNHGQSEIGRREGYTGIRFTVESLGEIIAKEDDRKDVRRFR